MIKIEVNMKQNDEPRIDLVSLCNKLGLNWFSYQEEIRGQKDENGKPKMATVYFIHEQGSETGVKFTRKRSMAEQVMLYSIVSLLPYAPSFVVWAGNRGLRLLTTMSEEARAEVRRQREALEAMKEASAAGEHVNVQAGVAPVAQVV